MGSIVSSCTSDEAHTTGWACYDYDTDQESSVEMCSHIAVHTDGRSTMVGHALTVVLLLQRNMKAVKHFKIIIS
jgi:hypothetical protein